MKQTGPPFGFVIGVVSLSLVIAAPLVAWSPATPGRVLILPALLGALVALVLGAWRLAILTVWHGAAGPAGYHVIYPLMGLAALCAFQVWHYQQPKGGA